MRSKMFAKMVESAQKKVEGNNFDMRKTLLQYDDVVNKHRTIIYEKRNEILDSESIRENINDVVMDYVDQLVGNHFEGGASISDLSELVETVNNGLLKKKIEVDEISNLDLEKTVEFIYNRIIAEYEEKIESLPKEIVDEFEKAISLRVIDMFWMEHINALSHLKEGITLRGYAQEDPLRAYTKEGFMLFDSLLNNIDREITMYLLNAQIRQNIERKKVVENEITNEDTTTVRKPKKVDKVGRNEPCTCGSGKKYKQCCGK